MTKRIQPIIMIAVIYAVVFMNFTIISADDKIKKSENKSKEIQELIRSGEDPHSYQNAVDMYQISATLNEDSTMVELIDKIGATLKAGYRIEENKTWNYLNNLNPYRKHDKVLQSVNEWADLVAEKIKKNNASVALSKRMEQANNSYKAGEFETASNKYREIIKSYPGHFDARNNLALSQMYLGNDLISLLEIEIILSAKPDYIPAQINKVVVLERMGQRERAKKLAHDLSESNKDIAMVKYNSAWYLNLDGQYKEADALLSPLQDSNVKAKYKKLYNLTKKQIEAERNILESALDKILHYVKQVEVEGTILESPVLQNGIVEKWGFRKSRIFFVLSIIVFLIVSFFACAMSSLLRVFAFIIGGILYVLFWGIPSGLWWVPFGIYVFIYTSLAMSAAKKR